MNLRRSFFRLWMILSVLYVASVSAILFEDVKGALDKALNPFDEKDAHIFPVDCKDARGKDGIDYQLDGKKKLCWYTEEKFRTLWREHKDLPTVYLANVFYSRADMSIPERPAPLKLFLQILLITIAPPLVILLIGSALRRVFAGFRRA